MFYLINMPTPREKLVYEYRLRRPEAQRLLEISERTLNRFIETGQVLDETHVMMLMQLDPGAVSRFVGPYFQKVPDQPMAASSGGLTGQATLHTVIAAVLVMVGTHEAVPAMERLARLETTPKPNHDNPFSIAWIAALAIAQRDPWPQVDDWLASLVDEKQPLVLNAETVPELGGTAAGLLLQRHQMSPYTFDLEPAGNDAFDRSSFAGFRFTSDEGRKASAPVVGEGKEARSESRGAVRGGAVTPSRNPSIDHGREFRDAPMVFAIAADTIRHRNRAGGVLRLPCQLGPATAGFSRPRKMQA